MTNPFVHAMVFAAAVLIPGGLLVYFGWLAYKARINNIRPDAEQPTPEEARDAFMAMYPVDSLRARSRKSQLLRARAFRRRDPPK